jgi:hypothetical protein
MITMAADANEPAQLQWMPLNGLMTSGHFQPGRFHKPYATHDGKIPTNTNKINPGMKNPLKGELSIKKRGSCMSLPSGEIIMSAPLTIAPKPNNTCSHINTTTLIGKALFCRTILTLQIFL